MNPQLESEPRRILIIDDNDAIHNDFRKTLTTPSHAAVGSRLASAKAALFGAQGQAAAPPLPVFELQSALQGQEGLDKLIAARLAGKPFRVAFVDMRMPPGWDGIQTIQKLWEADGNLQVVICTAYSDYSWEEIAQKLGLSDRLLILKKPFDPAEVSQLAASLSEKWALKQKAQLRMDELEEIVQQRTAALAHTSLHDKLTGLPNRALLQDRLTQAIERRKRNPDYHFALFFLDFDRFKLINDSLGHNVGDQLLIAISDRLRQSLRTTDSICHPDSSTASRLGGDEFVILADDLKDIRDTAVLADRFLKLLSQPYLVKGHTINSSASIGITTSSMGYGFAEDMLRDADTAMYNAKASGKARFVLFDRQMHEKVSARLELENDLQHAMERAELLLHYQPIVSMSAGKVEGFEALVRWKHPLRGLVPPNEFIPCCEETGMIVPIGFWVLREACQQLKAWQDAFPALPDLTMSINISGKQLSAPGLVTQVEEIFRQTGVDAHSIILEITETVMMHNAEFVIPVLTQLRALGVRLHLDDFGTGYSSLSCLHRFPLSGLKIDKSFVHAMKERQDYVAVVQGIVSMAHSLGMSLVAEGIESSDQATMLQSMDCDNAQGYFFNRPMDAAKAQAFLAAGMKPPAAPPSSPPSAAAA